MSNDRDPGESFRQKLDETSYAAGGRGRSRDRSSRTTDPRDVSHDATDSPRSEGAANALESARFLHRMPRDSQGDPSWRTIDHSPVNTVSRPSESLRLDIAAAPGSSLWLPNENFMGRGYLGAVWAPKEAPKALEFQLGLGIRDKPSESPADESFWRPEVTPSAREMGGDSNVWTERSPGGSGSPWKLKSRENLSLKLDSNSPRTPPTFNSLALDVSYAGLDTSGILDRESSRKSQDDDPPEFWEDFSVVECLEKKMASNDDSTPEERVETLREVLAETDIHEGDGAVSDFLFHVAKTKYGKIYIRVIRTMLLNRGRT